MSVTIPKTQIAAVADHKGAPYKVEKHWPVTQPEDLKPGEVLVKIHYTGVCHTDVHVFHGDWPVTPAFPLVGGHEGAGEIVAIAAHTKTHLKVGDYVGIKWLADACMHCSYCRQGLDPSCQEAKLSGCSVPGTFQQYVVSFADHVTPIPKTYPLEYAAPILCAGVTVYSALKNSRAKCGEYVVVPGAGGGLGHLALQYAHSMGLRTISIDTGAAKEKLCKDLGTSAWIDFAQEKDIIGAVRKATEGLGAHAAIVAAANAESYESALEYLRPRGVLVAVGLPSDTKIKADVFWTVLFSKEIVGSYVGSRQDAVEALDIAARQNIRSHIAIEPLENLPSVIQRLKEGKVTGRIVLKCF